MMAAIAPIIRVFFSSTFTDFQAERNALQERVFPSVRRYCNERGARFLPIDLRWGISDEASQDQRIVRICLEEIRRCQAVSPYFNFVASLGDRYGTCLLPETIPQTDLDVLLASMNPGDRKMVLHYYKLDMNSIPAEYLLQPAPNHLPEWKQIALQLQAILVEASKSAPISQLMHLRLTASVTEQEIHAGIFQTTSSSHALCFIRTSSGTSIDPRQGEQHSTNQIQLADLKRRVEQKLPTGTVWYPATWENDELTSPSMDAFCELVEYHLCAKIEEALKKEDLEKKSSQWDLTSWNFVHDRLMYFTGRHTSLDTIRKYIASIIPIPLIITGPSGVGKTTLLLQAAKEAARSHPSSVHLYYFIGGNTTVATTPALLRDLFGQLLKAYPDLVPIDIPENPAALIMKINDFLALAGEDQPLILFIDALDQLQSTDTTSWLPSFLPPYVRLIVSLLPGTELHALRIQLPSDQILELEGLTTNEGTELLLKWLNGSHRTLTFSQRDALLQNFASFPMPLYLRLLVEEAKQWPSFQAVPSCIPPDTSTLLASIFERLESPNQHGAALVIHTLGLIAASKNGLGEDELLDVLSQNRHVLETMVHTRKDAPHASRLPPVLWARLYADLDFLLTERNIDNALLLGFYHQQVAEVVLRRYLTGALEQTRHRDLARYFAFQDCYLVNTPDRPFDMVNERMVNELPYQQDKGRLHEDLKQTLTNMTFLQAKITVAQTIGAIEDLQRMRDETVFRDLIKALRLSSEILDNRPQELLNQLYGRSIDITSVLNNFPRFPTVHLLLSSPSLESIHGNMVSRLLSKIDATDFTLSPNGKLLAAGTWKGKLYIYDLEAQTRLPSITVGSHVDELGRGGLEHLVFSEDSRYLIFQADPNVEIWKIEENDKLGLHLRLQNDVYTSSWQNGKELIGYYPYRNYIIVRNIVTDGDELDEVGPLQVWDIETKNLLYEIPIDGQIFDVNVPFLFTNSYMIFADKNGTLRVIDPRTGSIVKQYSHPAKNISFIAITDDENYLICEAANYHPNKTYYLSIWNIDDDTLFKEYYQENTFEQSNITINDTVWRIMISNDYSMRMWKMKGNTISHSIVGFTNHKSKQAISKNGRYTALQQRNMILVKDVLAGNEINAMNCYSSIEHVLFTPDSKYIISLTQDHLLRLWQVISPHISKNGEDSSLPINHLIANRNIPVAVASTAEYTPSETSLYRVWDPRTGQMCFSLTDGKSLTTCAALSVDGRYIVSGTNNKTIQLWETATGKLIQVLVGHEKIVKSVDISLDDKYIVSSSADGMVRVWDWQKAKTINVIKCPDVEKVLFTYVNTRIVLQTMTHVYEVVDCLADQRLIMRVECLNTAFIHDICSTEQKKYTIISSQTSSIPKNASSYLEIWDGQNNRLWRKNLPGGIQDVFTSYDMKTLGAIYERDTIGFYDIDTGRSIRTIHKSSLSHLLPTAYSNYYIALMSDRTIGIWNFDTGKITGTFTDDSELDQIAMSLEGQMVIAGGKTGRIHFLQIVDAHI